MAESDRGIHSGRGQLIGLFAAGAVLLSVACANPVVMATAAEQAAADGQAPAQARPAPPDFAAAADAVRATLGSRLGGGEPEYPLITYGALHQPGNYEAMRARVSGTRAIVATGHHLATQAGYDAFRAGGNAFDAGVTAAMLVKALKMDYAGWTGVGPLTYYSAKDKQVGTRVGTGPTPALFTLEAFTKSEDNIVRSLVPTDIDVWTSALTKYGTISFKAAAMPTVEVMERGYPLYKMQQSVILGAMKGIQRWPYNASFFLQNADKGHAIGSVMKNADLAKTIRYMIEAERQALAKGKSREDGIRAARDAFYKGEPARAVDKFYRENGGLVRYDDLAKYEGKWMAPVHTTYRGYDVYSPNGWSQGPRLILILNILENFDLKSLGYMSADYIHILSQAVGLAMSDSYKWVGDPDKVTIPPQLWSKEYGKLRSSLIDRTRAFQDMPPWGDPIRMLAISPDSPITFVAPPTRAAAPAPEPAIEKMVLDTTSVNTIDAAGNIYAQTVSDQMTSLPMIPGWGFGLGGRAENFDSNPESANVAAPGKRPRNTNSPFVIMKDGKPFMGLSTPGADQQIQILLQVLLNVIEWNMPVEHAVDQPRFGSMNFPETGARGGDYNNNPGRIAIESRVGKNVIERLTQMGHKVQSWGLWNHRTGSPTVTYRDPKTGLLVGASDVRREGTALGY